MDPTTSLITTIVSICIVLFGIVAVVVSLYGIFVWYPRHRQKRVEALKTTGKQGEATIVRLPDHELGPLPGRSSVFTRVPVGLQIRIPGMEPYEVDKVFTFPTPALGALEVGKVVAVWVDPQEPRNLDKIVIHVQ
jgi:hypothetical protein